MSSPTPYELSYDFTGFQTANPTTPLPADKVEIEFNNIQRTTDEIISNLAVLQRSDGQLNNGIVGYDALSDDAKQRLGGDGVDQITLDAIQANTDAIQANTDDIAAIKSHGFIYAADEFDTTANDCTAGMTACIEKAASEGKIIILPPGRIKLGEVPLLTGVQIWGQGGDGYGVDGSGNLVTWANTTFERVAGAASVFDAGVGGDVRGVRLSGFAIDGVNYDCDGITGEFYYLRVDNLYIGHCNRGIGSESLYGHILMAHHSTFFNNNIHIKDLVDSHCDNIVCAAARDDSIQLLAGADSNLFSNCRIEWGYGYGVTAYGSQRLNFSNCQIDRHGGGGVFIGDTANHIEFTGGFIHRCADRHATDHYASVFIDGTANNIQFTGVDFNHGKNDDMTGTDSPDYHFWFNSGTINRVGIVGCLGLDTALVAPVYYNAAQPTPLRIRNNLGIDDIVLGQTVNHDGDGDYFSKVELLAVGAATTGNFDLTCPGISTYSRSPRTLSVLARDNTSGATYQGNFSLSIAREGAGASVIASAIYGEIGTAGVIQVGSGTLNLGFTNIATDGSAFRVTCANTVGNTVTVTMRLT